MASPGAINTKSAPHWHVRNQYDSPEAQARDPIFSCNAKLAERLAPVAEKENYSGGGRGAALVGSELPPPPGRPVDHIIGRWRESAGEEGIANALSFRWNAADALPRAAIYRAALFRPPATWA